MTHRKTILFLFLTLTTSLFAYAQTTPKTIALKATTNSLKSSAAFAEVLLRKTERESELEEFMLDYTEEFPKVKELRFELDLLNKEINKILAVNASEAGKLTLALGKLIVRKTELETDVWNLRRQYGDDHPEVKRAKRKVEGFEKAIKEILP